jgi:molecular chaperone GrpE
MPEPGADPSSPNLEQAASPQAAALDATESPEIAALRAELDAAQASASQHRDQLLRTAAEMENIRRRTARDVEQAHKFALEKFALELLPIADSLEQAAASSAGADAATLAAGQEATLKLLSRAFERFSLNAIDPVGEPFDPERHEAMAMQPSATAEPGSVLQVVQRGYELNGRLLRPARVLVARAPDAT